jgi:hypothetical protein
MYTDVHYIAGRSVTDTAHFSERCMEHCPMAEFDSPWKESLDVYFESFLQLCFPAIQPEIDWLRGYEPLDKEIQKLSPKGAVGPRGVDKLMRVWRNSGEEEWILVHIEVQSQRTRDLPERIFVYHYRLLDRYNREVVSLAVLGDDQVNWRPSRYRHELFGCEVTFRFPIVKLLDYASRTEELERSANPFATLVLAHLKSQETKGDVSSRYIWKFRLVKGLYEKGWDKDRVRSLFRFIDWLLDLPPELDQQLSEELSRFEEEKQMPYVTSIERLALEKSRKEGRKEGREEGREEGLLKGIKSVLEIRFGPEAAAIMTQVRHLSSAAVLEKVLQASKTVDCPEDLAALWAVESEESRQDDNRPDA